MPDLGVLNPNPGAQQPLVAPQPAPPSPDSIKLQQALALALMKQGQDTSPIRSPWQGVARVVQSVMGGYDAYQAQQQEANARQQAVDAFTKAIQGGGTPAPAPAAPAPVAPPAAEGTPMSENAPSAPSQYQPLIAQASQQYGIPQDILTKQLNAESNFNPNAVSPAGAQGIAQFMPGTAKEMGVNALDPNSAIPGAAAYVAQNRDRYGGDMAKALAAYNWGPGNVDKWVAAGANPNALPAETRNYVTKILGPNALVGGTQVASADNAMAFAPSSDNPLAAPPPAPKPNPLAAALAQNSTPAAPSSQAGNLAAILGAMSNPYLPSGLQGVGAQIAAKNLQPQYGFQTLPDGTIVRTDPAHGTVTPIYQSSKPQFVPNASHDQYGNPLGGFVDPTTQSIKLIGANGQPIQPQQQGAMTAPPGGDLHGEDFLKTLDPGKAETVKGIAEGRIPYPSGFIMKTPYGQWLTQAVGQYEPGIDATKIGQRSTFNKQLGSASPGSVGGQKTLMGTSLGHLAEVANAAADLGNSNGMGIAAAGHAVNAIRGMGTDQAAKMNKLAETVDRFSGEVGKLYSGSSGGGVAERDQTRARFSGTQTPAELAGALEASRDLINSKLQALQSQQDELFGPDYKGKIDFLGDNGRRALSSIDAAIAKLRGGSPQDAETAQQSGPSRSDIEAEMRRRGLLQ